MRTIPAMLIATFLAAPAMADDARYTDDDIRETIVGRTIYLAAPMGGEFPLNYRPTGNVDGDGQALGLGRFARPNDSGNWWIDSDRLCQQFESWYNGSPMCFELFRVDERRVKWVRDNGQTGVARIGDPL